MPTPYLTVRMEREMQDVLRSSATRLGYPSFTDAVHQALAYHLLGEMRPYDPRIERRLERARERASAG
jgi:hypothetical protein